LSSEFDGESIVFQCECGQKMKVPAARAGAKGRCKACGRGMIVPTPHRSSHREKPAEPPGYHVSPHHRRSLEGTFSEEDLITYPEQLPVKEVVAEPIDGLTEKKSLFEMLGEILKYPVANKQAAQIFLTGAILFSPIVWKVVTLAGYLSIIVGCLAVLLQGFIIISILGIWLMYSSYLLLVIEKSAEGSRRIPDLPVFTSWQDNLQDLLKVLGVSVIAFSPFLVYTASLNIEIYGGMLEAYSRGQAPAEEVLGGASAGLGVQMLLYAVAAFYMPMVLMALVVTKKFGKAVNPVFIFRSISDIWREYLAAMVIIFLFLRVALTLFTMLKDLLAVDWFSGLIGYIAEPIVTFYAVIVTMHVIGLLHYRNREKLQWWQA